MKLYGFVYLLKKRVTPASSIPTKAELTQINNLLKQYTEDEIKQAFNIYTEVTPPQYRSVLSFFKKRDIFFSENAKKVFEVLEVINQEMGWSYKMEELVFYRILYLIEKGFSKEDFIEACKGFKNRIYDDYAYDRSLKITTASYNIHVFLDRFQDFLFYKKQELLEEVVKKTQKTIQTMKELEGNRMTSLPYYKEDALAVLFRVLSDFFNNQKNSMIVITEEVAKALKITSIVKTLIQKYSADEACRRYRKMIKNMQNNDYTGITFLTKTTIEAREVDVFVLNPDLTIEFKGKRSIYRL